MLDFCLSVGLPVWLEDLGIINPSKEEIRKVAEATTAPGETIHALFPGDREHGGGGHLDGRRSGSEYKKR